MISVSDKCSALSIHQKIKKKISRFKISFDHKSAYYNDFWKSCDTKDWSNDAENTALITEINYSLTYINIENRYVKL